jgi:putative heme-binding domain-containing protein
MKVWLNGKLVHQRDQARAFQPDAERFEATLGKGMNRICLQLSDAKGAAEFHLRFRRKSTQREHEQLIQAALSRAGNIERGRKVFLNTQRTQCLKCHQLETQGERIGPELTGIGSRFPKMYLIESILEPNRTVHPGYQSLTVGLTDGRTLTGVKIAETDSTLTLADQKGEKLVVAKADIDRQKPSTVSTMPEGLEKPLSVEEFVDLIAFLASQKGKSPAPSVVGN